MEAKEIRIRRPGPIRPTKKFDNLGIFVLDGSGSMAEETAPHITKAHTVSLVLNMLFSRFKASSNRNNFSFAIVNYDHRSRIKMQPTPVKT